MRETTKQIIVDKESRPSKSTVTCNPVLDLSGAVPIRSLILYTFRKRAGTKVEWDKLACLSTENPLLT
jgi:hypothetical protein